jgi:hypothetical protein
MNDLIVEKAYEKKRYGCWECSSVPTFQRKERLSHTLLSVHSDRFPAQFVLEEPALPTLVLFKEAGSRHIGVTALYQDYQD